MIIAAAMTDITVPASLGLSVLGIVIVFIVLIFLMVIIYVMTTIIRKSSTKAATVIGSAEAPAVPLQQIEPASDIPAPDVPASDFPASDVPASDVPAFDVPASDVQASAVRISEATADSASAPESETAPVPLPEATAARKYRVVVNTVEYEVDSEPSLPVPYSSFLEEAFAEASAEAAQEAPAVPAASTDAIPELVGVRKYRVVVNSVEYEVDAETGGIITSGIVYESEPGWGL